MLCSGKVNILGNLHLLGESELEALNLLLSAAAQELCSRLPGLSVAERRLIVVRGIEKGSLEIVVGDTNVYLRPVPEDAVPEAGPFGRSSSHMYCEFS